MTLREAIDRYVAWRRALGARFQSQVYALRRYSRQVGKAVDCDAVRSDQVNAFLGSRAPASKNRLFLYCTLAGFYRYAITRSLATHSPLPVEAPKAPPAAPSPGTAGPPPAAAARRRPSSAVEPAHHPTPAKAFKPSCGGIHAGCMGRLRGHR